MSFAKPLYSITYNTAETADHIIHYCLFTVIDDSRTKTFGEYVFSIMTSGILNSSDDLSRNEHDRYAVFKLMPKILVDSIINEPSLNRLVEVRINVFVSKKTGIVERYIITGINRLVTGYVGDKLITDNIIEPTETNIMYSNYDQSSLKIYIEDKLSAHNVPAYVTIKDKSIISEYYLHDKFIKRTSSTIKTIT